MCIVRERTLILRLSQHNTLNELLWQAEAPENRKLDLDFPSWSWLSIDGRVGKR